MRYFRLWYCCAHEGVPVFAGAFGWVQHARNKATGSLACNQSCLPVARQSFDRLLAASLIQAQPGCLYSAGEEVAIKFIQLGPRFYSKYVERELFNHRLLAHPHIVSFKEVFITSHWLAIVMEYVGGGNLQQYVEKKSRLPEWEARCFFQQVSMLCNFGSMPMRYFAYHTDGPRSFPCLASSSMCSSHRPMSQCLSGD